MEIQPINSQGYAVVGKPTTYPIDTCSITFNDPYNINLEAILPDSNSLYPYDYFLATLRDNFSIHLSVEPVCRCRQVDLDDVTDVYLCRTFKHPIYIQVTDGLITLSRTKPKFNLHDYSIEAFDIPIYTLHRTLICEAFLVLSVDPECFVGLVGVCDNAFSIPLYN